MTAITRVLVVATTAGLLASPALAQKHYLLTGIDHYLYPGAERYVTPVPGPGIPGPVYDGDRLAGTADVGPVAAFQGTGTPMYQPNEFGSLSMFYRRGSVPLGPAGNYPLQGIEFLGGPLLDLDGDLGNGARSLVPVESSPGVYATPVAIPGTDSFIELEFDLAGGTVQLVDFQSLGTNETGPDINAENATVMFVIAGTEPDDTRSGPINPSIDTRAGTLTPFALKSGVAGTIFRISDLGYEIWEDSIDPGSSSAAQLGTMQFLGAMRGWLVLRDPATGQFPALAGQGLGTTLWPLVDTSQLGQSFNTANGLAGGSATIGEGLPRTNPRDLFTAPGNGGLPLTDFGGDLGAYLDHVIGQVVPDDATSLVYLEAAGFGINNSFDPIFGDTVSYDVVILAAASDPCGGTRRGDANCDGVVDTADIDSFVLAIVDEAAWRATHGCDFVCANDTNGDGAVDTGDIDAFVTLVVSGG
jgi:hypothetical protein